MPNNLENSLKEIMSAVFTVDKNELDHNSSPEDISSWDSLKHLNLVAAIETELNIDLSDDEIVCLTDFHNILLIIEKKYKDK